VTRLGEASAFGWRARKKNRSDGVPPAAQELGSQRPDTRSKNTRRTVKSSTSGDVRTYENRGVMRAARGTAEPGAANECRNRSQPEKNQRKPVAFDLNRRTGPRTSGERKRITEPAARLSRRSRVSRGAMLSQRRHVVRDKRKLERCACDRRRGNLWAKSIGGRKTSTQKQIAAARFGTGYETLAHGLASRGGVLQTAALLRKPRTKSRESPGGAVLLENEKRSGTQAVAA
jgi:hypothetical protein